MFLDAHLAERRALSRGHLHEPDPSCYKLVGGSRYCGCAIDWRTRDAEDSSLTKKDKEEKTYVWTSGQCNPHAEAC